VKAVQRYEHDGLLLPGLRREDLAGVAGLKEPGDAKKPPDSTSQFPPFMGSVKQNLFQMRHDCVEAKSYLISEFVHVRHCNY
jgi:hypothetical protein